MLGVFNKCANSRGVCGGVLDSKVSEVFEGCKVFESGNGMFFFGKRVDDDDSVSDGKTDGDDAISDGKTDGDDAVSDGKTDGDDSVSDGTGCKKVLKPLV